MEKDLERAKEEFDVAVKAYDKIKKYTKKK